MGFYHSSNSAILFRVSLVTNGTTWHTTRVTLRRPSRAFCRRDKLNLRVPTSPFRRRTRRHVFMGVRRGLLIVILRNSITTFTVHGFLRRKIRGLMRVLLRLFAPRETMCIRRRYFIVPSLIRSIRGYFNPYVGTLTTFRHLSYVFHRSPIRRVMGVLRIMMGNRTIRTTILNSVISHSLVRKLFRRRLFRQYFRYPLHYL